MSIGLAMQGYVPITCYPRFDFLILAFNQLVNHLDKIRQMSPYAFKHYIPSEMLDTHIKPPDNTRVYKLSELLSIIEKDFKEFCRINPTRCFKSMCLLNYCRGFGPPTRTPLFNNQGVMLAVSSQGPNSDLLGDIPTQEILLPNSQPTETFGP
jgi:hypothetical protein